MHSVLTDVRQPAAQGTTWEANNGNLDGLLSSSEENRGPKVSVISQMGESDTLFLASGPRHACSAQTYMKGKHTHETNNFF